MRQSEHGEVHWNVQNSELELPSFLGQVSQIRRKSVACMQGARESPTARNCEHPGPPTSPESAPHARGAANLRLRVGGGMGGALRAPPSS